MKKSMAILCAAALLCGGLTACSHGSNSSSSTATPAAEKLAFNLADISMSSSFEDITDISRDPVSGKVLVFGRLAGGNYAGYVTTRTFEEYEEFRFTPQEGELVKYAAMLRSGRKAVLTVLNGTTCIYVYGSDNKQEKVIDCGDLLGEDDYGTLIAGESSIIIDRSVMGRRELTAVSVSDEKVLGQVKLDEDMLVGVSADKDGVLTVVYGSPDKTYTAHIDGTTLTDKTECGRLTTTAYSLCAGCGDYSLVANIGSSLYGLRDGEWVEFSNSMDTDFQFYELRSLVMTAQDELAALQYVGAHPKLVLLTAQDISELKSKELVTIVKWLPSTSSSWEYDKEVKAFNAQSEDYRVEFKSYYNEETNDRDYDRLRLDLLSGDGPDIIPFDPYFTADSFSSGVFCDLYEYIDEDPELSRDDFIPNVREAFERDGKMVMMTPTIQTLKTVVAKSGYTGVRENWSFDDMIASYNAKPEDMYFFDPDEEYSYRGSLFDNTVMNQFFVDYDNAECHFDSPEYIKMLNFFSDNNIGLTIDEYRHQDENGVGGYVQDDVIEGKTFIDFNRSDCGMFLSLFTTVRYYFGNDCVFVGYPYDGKESGSFLVLDTCLGIVANSPHKEGAWSFLRYLLSDDCYGLVGNYGKLPTIESRFDEIAQQSVDGFLELAHGENGEVVEGDLVKWNWELPVVEFDGKNFVDKGTVKLEPFTQEECDYYKNMIKNSNVIRYDGNITEIVTDETDSFFNYECTAEECAARIQNRASIYMSERYG